MKRLFAGFLACLAMAASPTPPHLTALGDSITYGVGASDRNTTSYAVILANELGAELTNLGISGETAIPEPNEYFTGTTVAGEVYAAHAGVLADEVSRIPLDTTIVTLYIGTNDLWLASAHTSADYSNADALYTAVAADYARYLSATVSAIRERVPLARIVIATNINPADKGAIAGVTSGPAFKYRQAMTALVNNMNAAVRAQGAIVADLHCDTQLYDTANYLSAVDVHPNDTGHARIAEDFYKAIVTGGTVQTCAYDSATVEAPPQAHL